MNTDLYGQIKDSTSNIGDVSAVRRFMDRAQNGEDLTVGFIGGSITEGARATKPENCYAHLVYDRLACKFPSANLTYINAGIGGTTSQFGCARVQSDLLRYHPDLVFVEFSVNDRNTPFFCETYEGLVRQILKTGAAVMLIHNVRYDSGLSAEPEHSKIAEHYDLPAVSIKKAIYPLIPDIIPKRMITEDDLHPNDLGHSLVSKAIMNRLEEICNPGDRPEGLPDDRQKPVSLPEPLTANRYEHAVRLQNMNSSPVCDGFYPDPAPQLAVAEKFRNGWTASRIGSNITFEIDSDILAVQYRKTITRPAPVAEVYVDGEKQAVLDGNFEEDWGDKLSIEIIELPEGFGKHQVRIELTETHEDDRSPFYLASVIAK